MIFIDAGADVAPELRVRRKKPQGSEDSTLRYRKTALRDPVEEFVPGAGEGEEPGAAVVEA